MRVLVVEDSPVEAGRVATVLESAGFVAVVVPDGESALEQCAENVPDVALVDLLLPGISGYDVCRHLKSQPCSRDVPVVVLTSLSAPMDVVQALAAGADAFVSKPWSDEQLLARITQTLASHASRSDEARVRVETRGIHLEATPSRLVEVLVSALEDARDRAAEAERVEAERRRHEEEVRSFEQQLIGIVSHDLRNPLNAMVGSAALLLSRRGLGAQEARSLTRILSSGDRAMRLIRDLLDLTQARLGSGIPVHRSAIDLHPLVQHVVDEVQASNPDREIVLTLAGEGHGVWDGDRISQVVANLLSNAVQHSPRGTPVHVAAGGDEDTVIVSVHNEGAPIPAALLPGLFTAMTRATTSKSAEGVGLGLFIVDHLVRAHGGTVDVRSLDGAGTTFTVHLPREPRVQLA